MPLAPSRKQNGEVGASCSVLGCSFSVPLLLDAYPAISRPECFQIALLALLGELGSGLLPGVYLSSCILIYVLAHSLSQKRLGAKSTSFPQHPCQKPVVMSRRKRA